MRLNKNIYVALCMLNVCVTQMSAFPFGDKEVNRRQDWKELVSTCLRERDPGYPKDHLSPRHCVYLCLFNQNAGTKAALKNGTLLRWGEMGARLFLGQAQGFLEPTSRDARKCAPSLGQEIINQNDSQTEPSCSAPCFQSRC